MANKVILPEKINITTQEHNSISLPERDLEIFFDALMNPPRPNQKLRDAAERYKLFIKEHK